ncbi:MAG: hypothetical protein D6746_09785 [Bacteroidetes bacterium]|nr:MAG: hypothetical protein D6746_09785 [Bacteroidota bacterium]
MMALRRYMKENKLRSIKQLKKEDWQAVAEKAGQYALAMVRPNAAAFQYGALSLPFQFLQFSHKVFLTFLRAFGKNVGNQAFTVSEARKILAGQLILFGAAGLGVKPLAESLIEKNETLRNADPVIKDILAGGILDLLIDNSLNFAIEKFTGRESDMDLAWDEFLAPGANVINILRDMIELAFEAPLTEAWLGPSEMTFSRYIQGYRLARSMVEVEGIPENVKWSRAADALLAGAFAGYSDFFKARLAAKHMAWISRNGQETAVKASFEEAVAKGLIGISSEAALDSYRTYESQKNLEEELTKIAYRYADDASMLIKAYSESEDESLLIQLNNIKLAIQAATDENEWEFIVDKFNERMLSNRDPRTSGVEALITKLMTEGLPASEYTKAVIRRSNQLTDEEKEAAIAFIEDWERQAEVASSMNLKMLESDIDTSSTILHNREVMSGK